MDLERFYNDYQDFTATTALYPTQVEREYLALGLCSEAGEIAELDATDIAVDEDITRTVDEMVKELGDCMWYVARLAAFYQWPLYDLVLHARLLADMLEKSAMSTLPDCVLGLCASAGSAAGVIKKQLRDGASYSGEKMQQEADKLRGALVAHVAAVVAIARMLAVIRSGVDLEHILERNRIKLTGRKERGTIRGEGNER
jgi:hypothetical protein